VQIDEPETLKKVATPAPAFSLSKWFRPYSASDDEENTKPQEIERRMSTLIAPAIPQNRPPSKTEMKVAQ